MPKPSEEDRRKLEEGIVGLGEGSIRKTFWGQLRRTTVELERFRLLLDRAQELILLVSCQRAEVIDANAAFTRLGWPAEALIGRPVEDLFRDRMPRLLGALGEARGSGSAEPALNWVVTPGGEEVPVELTWEVTHFDGRPFAVIVGRDVSRRLADEKALQSTVAELSRSNAELERFAYIASHDLKEPLRTIISFAQLLERQAGGTLNGPARESLDFLTAGAKRMHQLVSDLLDYSRIMGRTTPFQSVDLNLQAQAAIQSLREQLEECDARVTVRAPLPVVTGDPGQMTQVIQNLVSNAVKFRRPGVPPQVRIWAQRWEAEWWISVSDNGIGIEESYVDEVFKVFQRLHTIAAYPGTGIGLAICKAVVERHHGRIWIESVAGQGTTVTFSLPAPSLPASNSPA